MQPFDIPDDFRAFMQQVVAYLDVPSDDRFVDAEDALHSACGYGGRIDGADTYQFTYITPDGHHKWQITLREAALRDVADGLLIEVAGERHDIVRTRGRARTGDPLLIWGEYGDDALCPRDGDQVIAALDSLHASALDQPRMLRMWSSADDQLVAVVWGERCALYVIEALDGYATSAGDAVRTDSFEALDHDARPLTVPYADCVAWDVARRALIYFLAHGELGPDVRVEGRLPTMLLMLGDIDRKAMLAARAEPPRELARSSLPRMLSPVPELISEHERTAPVPVAIAAPLAGDELAAWARRLIAMLDQRELIELGASSLDEVTYQLGGLLQAHGSEAEHSLDTAEWLANEIGAVRGVARLFATGGDLQIALRRSREAG